MAGPLLAATPPRGPVEIPVLYAADRFFATPTTASGQPLRLYTDSGGGLFLLMETAKRLGKPGKPGSPGIDIIQEPASAGFSFPA